VPKVSVYLPDELAERVRHAGLPVSAICQAALLETLRQVDAATSVAVERGAVLPGDLDIQSPCVSHFVDAVNLAYARASTRGAALVETEDLLQGILDEGGSLILQTLDAIGVSRADIQSQLELQPGGSDQLPPGGGPACSPRARRAVHDAEVAANQSGRPVNLGHLLLALMDDGGGGASRALHSAGLDMATAQQAVAAMQSGWAFGLSSGQVSASTRTQSLLSDISDRLSRLERRLDIDD
jgi:ATP-dependent Clp protease ATP-binding subunit ClpA